jgi:2OG-Fe(II) oxygenase superfamily
MLSEYLGHCEDAGTHAKTGSARTGGKRIIEPVEASSRDRNLPSPQPLERCVQLGSQGTRPGFVDPLRCGRRDSLARRPASVEHVVGISLGTPATMRFRRRRPAGFDRASALLAPRSVYHLTGEARHEWEHSITAMVDTRWSITFRSLSKKGRLQEMRA